MTSYASGTCHLLTTALKASRVEKGTSLLNWLKSHPGVVKVFSDECPFTMDKFFNSRNDCYIASEPQELVPVVTSKKPAKNEFARKNYASMCNTIKK